MQQYIFPIQTAFLVFPFLAALFSFPFLVVQYHRYGAIPMIRAMVVYSFILYLLCTYFLVILPLPEIAEVAKRTDPFVNLSPYKSIITFWKNTHYQLFEAESWKIFYQTKMWQEPLLNVLMTIPFGIYLRYYFGRRWWQATLAGFGLSLFFELTQLSSLYGIYPRPYRMFDVSDLIGNTSGALIGFWITPLLVFFLPTKQKMDEIAYKRGEKISILRRGLAFLLDWAVVGIGLAVSLWLGAMAPFWLCGPLYFAFVPFFAKGYTIGSYLCSFKIVDKKGCRPSAWRCILRAGALYLSFSSTVCLWIVESKIRGRVPAMVVKSVVSLANVMEFLTLICVLALLMQSVQKLFSVEKRYYYEVLSGTYLVSTISFDDEEEQEVPPSAEPPQQTEQADWVYRVTTNR